METAQAILMVLGIYVAAPIVIGFAVAGAAVLWAGTARKTQQPAARAEAEEVAQHAFRT